MAKPEQIIEKAPSLVERLKATLAKLTGNGDDAQADAPQGKPENNSTKPSSSTQTASSRERSLGDAPVVADKSEEKSRLQAEELLIALVKNVAIAKGLDPEQAANIAKQDLQAGMSPVDLAQKTTQLQNSLVEESAKQTLQAIDQLKRLDVKLEGLKLFGQGSGVEANLNVVQSQTIGGKAPARGQELLHA